MRLFRKGFLQISTECITVGERFFIPLRYSLTQENIGQNVEKKKVRFNLFLIWLQY
jgi:hypothetical protein